MPLFGKSKKEDFEDFRKRIKQEWNDRINDILKLANKNCPLSYTKFVHLIFLELGFSYYQNQKRGVYSKEVDSLIAVGKLRLKNKLVYYV